MAKKLQSVRGTKDLFGEEAAKYTYITDVARRTGELYGFKPFSTPIFEFTEVFSRTLGDASDIVNKEMYCFEDRGGESLTLRPEFTAGIVRAFISNGLQQHLPLKLFSYGPLFRYERPQKGRQRQFHQVNFEWIGDAKPLADVELILMAANLLHYLGILPNTVLHINTLGDKETREHYRDALVQYFETCKNDLSEDSKMRLEKNPMRILDSKDPSDRKIVEGAPSLKDHLSDASKAHFDAVKAHIEATDLKRTLSIEYDDRLVRGLDYYTHTVFEFIGHGGELGAQSTVLAGGRYDKLIESMGGPDTPALGFAAGMERLALMLPDNISSSKPVAVVSLVSDTNDASALNQSLSIATKLREALISKTTPVELLHEKNLGKALKKVDRLSATHAVLVGLDEASGGQVALKDMASGEQSIVSIEQAIDTIHGGK